MNEEEQKRLDYLCYTILDMEDLQPISYEIICNDEQAYFIHLN